MYYNSLSRYFVLRLHQVDPIIRIVAHVSDVANGPLVTIVVIYLKEMSRVEMKNIRKM